MPLPTSINDLSTSEASNSPAGSESPTNFDNYLRWHASFIAALRDVVLSGTGNLSTANLAYSGTLTGSTGVINIGSGQFYKDGSGNVGVGTTNPSSYGKCAVVGAGDVVHVDSTSGAAGVVLYENGTGRGRIRSLNGSAGMALLANTTEIFRVDSTGVRVSGEMRLDATTSASASAGSNGDVPAQVSGYVTINIGGTDRKIPFYAA